MGIHLFVVKYFSVGVFVKLLEWMIYRLKFATCIVLANILTGFMIPFFMFNPKSVNNSKYASVIFRYLTLIMGVEWKVRDGHHIAEQRGAVIIANHQSIVDHIGMFQIWHLMDKVSTVLKKENFYIWPFGLAAYLAGVVFIDRNDPRSAYKELDIAARLMIKEKTKLFIFPEGTRCRQRTLLPFKKGAFKTAIASGVPILPIVFSPYYFINKDLCIFRKGRVIIQCLEAIPTVGLNLKDAEKLAEDIRSKMLLVYNDLCEEVLKDLPRDYPLLRVQ